LNGRRAWRSGNSTTGEITEGERGEWGRNGGKLVRGGFFFDSDLFYLWEGDSVVKGKGGGRECEELTGKDTKFFIFLM